MRTARAPASTAGCRRCPDCSCTLPKPCRPGTEKVFSGQNSLGAEPADQIASSCQRLQMVMCAHNAPHSSSDVCRTRCRSRCLKTSTSSARASWRRSTRRRHRGVQARSRVSLNQKTQTLLFRRAWWTAMLLFVCIISRVTLAVVPDNDRVRFVHMV